MLQHIVMSNKQMENVCSGGMPMGLQLKQQAMNIIGLGAAKPLVLQALTNVIRFNASKMQASSTQKTKDSAGRRLGVKVLGGQAVYPNDIIARQRGFKWKSGDNVIVGLDQTIHSKVEGIVSFRLSKERKIPFYYIDVIPQQLPNRRHGAPAPYIYHPELFPQRAHLNHPTLVKVDSYHLKVEQ